VELPAKRRLRNKVYYIGVQSLLDNAPLNAFIPLIMAKIIMV